MNGQDPIQAGRENFSRILAMEPIRHADTGQLWTSADFSACYLGELAPPEWSLLPAFGDTCEPVVLAAQLDD